MEEGQTQKGTVLRGGFVCGSVITMWLACVRWALGSGADERCALGGHFLSPPSPGLLLQGGLAAMGSQCANLSCQR